MLLLRMFQRKWLLATLLVFAGTALCVRLGIWQLDRLEQRRAFNHQVESMRAMPVLDLDQEQWSNISEMEWRAVELSGEYDFENQIALRNQYFQDEYGYHVLTPLFFNASTGQAPVAVLVDRGWIPAAGNSASTDWRKYDEAGTVDLTGQIRLGGTKPTFGGVEDPLSQNGDRLAIWNNADLARIAAQLPYPILPVYIQLDANENDEQPPIPYQPTIEITEGPHFGYALQWFTFATILFAGYPFFLRKQEA